MTEPFNSLPAAAALPLSKLASAAATPLFGIPLHLLIGAFVSITLGFTLARVSSFGLTRMREAIDPKAFHASLIAAGEKPASWAFVVVGVFFALKILPIPSEPVDIRHFTDAGLLAGTIILAIWFGMNLIESLCDLWLVTARDTDTPLDDQLVPIVRKSGKVFLIVAGGVMVVQNLGYSVASLLAGLGLGGAALALASKDTIANVFGSIVIFLDQPFYVGDWVEIGSHEGVVEEVGLRVTRLRTFANSLITIPNAQLTTVPINNWSRMRKRRIMLTLGLTYGTSPAKMTQAVEALREVLRQDSRICQDFHLVNFNNLGPHSLDVFVYCFTETTDWAEHLQIRPEILLAFMAAIEGLGLSFAFPTQTIHVDSMERLIPPGAPQAMTRELPL